MDQLFLFGPIKIAAVSQSWQRIKASALQVRAPVGRVLMLLSQPLAFGGAAGPTAPRLRCVPLTESLREGKGAFAPRLRLGHTRQDLPGLLVKARMRQPEGPRARKRITQVRQTHLVQQEWRGVGVGGSPRAFDVGNAPPAPGIGSSPNEGCGHGSSALRCA